MSTDNKRSGSDSERPSKRPKAGEQDPASNPYLAHMYNEEAEYSSSKGSDMIMSTFKRHNTTAEQATLAENGPMNPFNNKPLSKQYFRILETRRNLPVHQQRCVLTCVLMA